MLKKNTKVTDFCIHDYLEIRILTEKCTKDLKTYLHNTYYSGSSLIDIPCTKTANEN